MNRIDQKYKELLEKRTFPKSQKEKGWAGMQGMLDSEFPVSGAATGGASGAMAWRYGLGVLAVAITAGAIWWAVGTGQGKRGIYEPRAGESVANSSDKEDEGAEQVVQPISNNLETSLENAGETNQSAPNLPEENALDHSENRKGEGDANQNLAVGQGGDNTKKEAAGINPTSQAMASQSPEAMPKAVPEAGLKVAEKNTLNLAIVDKALPESKDEKSLATGKEAQTTPIDDPSFNEENPALEENANPDKAIENTASIPSETIGKEKPSGDTEGSESDRDKVVSNKAADGAEKAISKSDAENVPESNVNGIEVEVPVSQAVVPESSLEENSVESDAIAEGGIEAEKQSTEAENTSKLKTADWHFAFPKSQNQEEFEIPSLAGKRFALSVYGGYAYVGKLLKSQNPGYLMKRGAEEKPIYTTPTGVSIDYFMNPRWTFTIGLGYAEYGEELAYEVIRTDSAFVHGSYGSPSDYQNIISIDSVRVVDSIYKGHWNYNIVYQTEDTAVAQNNGRTSITYLEIPLMVGYRFGQGRVRPWLQSGISLGLPMASSFRYLNEDADGLDEQRARAIAPLQWNYRLSLGMDCKLSRHWSLRLSGLGSLQLNSLLQDTQARQRYYRLGGRLGLAYNF